MTIAHSIWVFINIYCVLKLKYTRICINFCFNPFSVRARMYVYVHVHNVMFVHVTKLRAHTHYACRSMLERYTQYTLCKFLFPMMPRSKCCSSKTWFMCTLCACNLVDCSNGTMDNTVAVILLYRRVSGSAPSNAPLRNKNEKLGIIV